MTRECKASQAAGIRLAVRVAHDLGWVPGTGMAAMQQELRPASHGRRIGPG